MDWYTKMRNLSVGLRFGHSFRDALLFLREQGKPIPDKETRRTASRHFMEKFVNKTSKTASAELIVSFLVDELKTPLNSAERLLLVQRSQKSAIAARISRARLVRGARQREASKVQSSLTKHWSFPGGSRLNRFLFGFLRGTRRGLNAPGPRPRPPTPRRKLLTTTTVYGRTPLTRTVAELQPPLQSYLALVWRYVHVFQGPLGLLIS